MLSTLRACLLYWTNNIKLLLFTKGLSKSHGFEKHLDLFLHFWVLEIHNLYRCSDLQAVSTAFWLRQDKFTQTTESCGGKGTARPLSQEKSALKFALTGFYWLNLHRNTGCIWKAHRSLSGRNDQIIDNIQITLRAYSESGSDS